MSETFRRGPYAKGIAKREEILQEALRAYAEADSSGPSLRAIAARVGLSERGLLHYFSSRDELLVAILAARDVVGRKVFNMDGPIEEMVGAQTNVTLTPGLVRLFLEMAVAAPDRSHAAHDFFTSRNSRLRGTLERMFVRSAERDDIPAPPQESTEFAARMLVAASDGLQLQWLLDPSIDLAADLLRLAKLLRNA
ncbi:MAG TPA: helix-turn-helix domain-containing protein [Galbitalea sp.]|jgi:AcrR family transcriptional regulator